MRAVGQVELVIQTTDVVADRLLTELQLRGDLGVVGTLRNHPEHVRLPLRQMSGRFFAEDPSGGLIAENLITQVTETTAALIASGEVSFSRTPAAPAIMVGRTRQSALDVRTRVLVCGYSEAIKPHQVDGVAA